MWVSELSLYDSSAFAARADPGLPSVRVSIPARINCIRRMRGGGGVPGWEGAVGALIAIGRSDGIVTLYDAAQGVGGGGCLTELVSWETPNRLAVYCLDIAPCGGFLVAGCAQGTLAVFALPALPAVVPLDAPTAADGDAASLLESFVSGAVAIGSAVESARGVAKFGKAIADEAGSVVRGLFSSLWGGSGSGSAGSQGGGAGGHKR